ncbi:hypothetical protein FACS1894123_03460 [Bacteroidia bacterium]|nr:hypothetical protein FACS1894123_03460 [Bacteroidia bacterium]
MKISIRGYITHKEAEKYSDCADRYAVNTGNNRFAIADGVSKSFFPDIWADILVNNFVALEKDSDLSITKWQAEWLEKVKEKVTAPDVKWYTKNAFIKQEPGLATFVGLRFENGRWFAKALGDSFLFFVPKESVGFDDWIKLSSKPEPVVFDSFPDYFSSRNKQHGETQTKNENLVAGTFYLMTDALSEWIFNQKEKAIEEIEEKWHSQEEFERSVTELRSLNVLNNDDSAILIIEVEDDGNVELVYKKDDIQNLSKLIEIEKSEEEVVAENKKESFVDEVKTEIANKETESKVLSNDEDNQETVEVETKTEIELSENAQAICHKSVTLYNETLKAIGKMIKGEGFFSVQMTIGASKKNKLSEDEQKQIKEELKKYGISFENRDSNSN